MVIFQNLKIGKKSKKAKGNTKKLPKSGEFFIQAFTNSRIDTHYKAVSQFKFTQIGKQCFKGERFCVPSPPAL